MGVRISRLDIAGFRVIEDLSLELRPLNVLIGENGSGKSTLLEAVDVLRKAAVMTREQFVSELYNVHGGRGCSATSRSRRRPGAAPSA